MKKKYVSLCLIGAIVAGLCLNLGIRMYPAAKIGVEAEKIINDLQWVVPLTDENRYQKKNYGEKYERIRIDEQIGPRELKAEPYKIVKDGWIRYIVNGKGERTIDIHDIYDQIDDYRHVAMLPIDENQEDWDRIVVLGRDYHPIFGGAVFREVRPYSEGLSYCIKYRYGDYEHLSICSKPEKGFMDEDGKLVIKTPGCIDTSDFSQGRAIVYTHDKVYIIDRDGNEIFSMKARAVIRHDLLMQCMEGFNEHGTAPIYDGKNWGLIDRNGNWIIKPVFGGIWWIGTEFIEISYLYKRGIARFPGGEK